MSGNEANIPIDNDKQTVVALREIAEKKNRFIQALGKYYISKSKIPTSRRC